MKVTYAQAYHSLTHGDGSLFRDYCKANNLDMHGSPIEELYLKRTAEDGASIDAQQHEGEGDLPVKSALLSGADKPASAPTPNTHEQYARSDSDAPYQSVAEFCALTDTDEGIAA